MSSLSPPSFTVDDWLMVSLFFHGGDEGKEAVKGFDLELLLHSGDKGKEAFTNPI